MVDHVVRTLGSTPGIERILLVTPSAGTVAAGVERIDDPGGGLNAALSHALARICALPGGTRPERLAVVHGDLPLLEAADCGMLAAAAGGTVTIAPDRHGTGTNALSLPLPEAAGFDFRVGQGSYALHRKAAEALGLSVQTIIRAGLEKDIDLPADLVDAEHLLSRQRHSA